MNRTLFPIRVILCLVIMSCSSEADIQQILGRHAEVPVFLEWRPLSTTEMVLSFSKPVRVVSLHFDPPLETGPVSEGQDLLISFLQPQSEGMKLTLDVLVEDADRNTLNLIIPVRTRNDRMPALVFNEVRTEYARPRVEFVEFYAPEGGNLGALRLFIASASLTTPVYEFPPVEVKRGEYIVVHLRSIEEGLVDETGQNLSLSGGNGASDHGRDFWVPGSSKLLRKTDALWIVDQDDRIIDALLLSESPGASWGQNNVRTAAEFLGRRGAWLPLAGDPDPEWVPSPSDAVIAGPGTATRTINRDETRPSQGRAGNWYVTVTSGHSPGRPNNPGRYQP